MALVVRICSINWLKDVNLLLFRFLENNLKIKIYRNYSPWILAKVVYEHFNVENLLHMLNMREFKIRIC